MNEFTILTKDQILEEEQKLNVRAKMSDFGIVLGGKIDADGFGCYWTKTVHFVEPKVIGVAQNGRAIYQLDDKNIVSVIDFNGKEQLRYTSDRTVGCRLSISYSAIQNVCENYHVVDGILKVEYGSYPQTVASRKMQVRLEEAYLNEDEELKRTGKMYTADSNKYNSYNNSFQETKIEEYEYRGKKYVRVSVNSCYNDHEMILSNGESYKNEEPVWLCVEPIVWFVDRKNDIALSENILFAGIQFHPKNRKNKKESLGYRYLLEISQKSFVEFSFCSLNFFIRDYVGDELMLATEKPKVKNIRRETK